MPTLTVPLGDRSYPIYIGPGLLESGAVLQRHLDTRHVLIVSNEIVAPLYLERVIRSLGDKQVATLVLPDGEEHKTMASAMAIFDTLLQRKFGRNSHLVALGGGVIGDLVGFAAACYQRGVPFIQIPTTLLSQVDSSVGGKTAVNHPLGKNMIGAFYQPKCVIADTDTLDTLNARELSAGLAEVIKYGLIRDSAFFDWLERHIDSLLAREAEALSFAIERSCRNKVEVVQADERESGERATLNLGHTFGHAIETALGYGNILHGEAVAIGLCQAADLSRRLGWLSAEEVTRIVRLLNRAGLPTHPPAALDADRYLEHMAVDKKNLDGEIRLILLRGIGQATLPTRVDRSKLIETLVSFGRHTAGGE